MRYVALLVAAAQIMACSGDAPPLVASDVRVSAPLPGAQMSSGYLTLTNNTSQAVTITQVTSPQFGRVEMHESVIEDGTARMYELGEVTILGGTSVDPGPSGIVGRFAAQGETRLHDFERSGETEVENGTAGDLQTRSHLLQVRGLREGHGHDHRASHGAAR